MLHGTPSYMQKKGKEGRIGQPKKSKALVSKCKESHTPGNLLEMQMLGFHPTFIESETLCVFKTSSDDSDPGLNLRTPSPRNKEKIMVSSVQLLEDGQVKADMKTRWEKQFLPGERLRGINSKSGRDLFFKRKCWIKKNNNQHISTQKVIFLQQG